MWKYGMLPEEAADIRTLAGIERDLTPPLLVR
jgi:hypothetical protein